MMARLDLPRRIYTYLREVGADSIPPFPVLRGEPVNMLCSFVCTAHDEGTKSDVI